MNSKHYMFTCSLEWGWEYIYVWEPDEGNMPYLKIVYQKKSREISNRKFVVNDKLHQVWLSLVNALLCLIKFEDFIFLLLANAILGGLAVQ